VLVLVIDLSVLGKMLEHEQEHEHDYDCEDAAKAVAACMT
jgi:hypothetical protein